MKKRIFLIFYMLMVIPLMTACFSETTSGDDGDTTTISAPTGVTATDGDYTDRIVISWTAVSNATYYNVYRCDTSNGTYVAIGGIASTSTSVYNSTTSPSDYPITVGTTYYYKVTALNGTTESALSSYDSGYASSGTTTLDAPTGVTATDGTYTDQIVISWTAVTGAANYNIYRSGSATGTYTKIGYVTSANTSAVNSTTSPSSYPITAGVTYYYKVTAEDSGGNESELSSYDSGYAGTITLDAPTGVTATDGTYPGAIYVSWTAVTGAARYYIYRATSSTGTYTKLGYVTATNVLFRSSDSSYPITFGITYYFKITAADSELVESGYSNIDSGYTYLSYGQAGIKFWNRYSGYSLSEIRAYSSSSGEPTCSYLTPTSYGSNLLSSYVAYNYYFLVYLIGGQYVDWYVKDTATYYNYDDNFSTYASHYYVANECFTLLWYGSSATYYNYDYYFTSKGGETDKGIEADFCIVQQPDGSFTNAALPKTDIQQPAVLEDLENKTAPGELEDAK